MKAHLFATSLLGITAGAAQHHNVVALEERQVASAVQSVCLTFQTTYLTLAVGTGNNGAPTQTQSSAQPTSTPAFTPVVLRIVPITTGTRKRDLEKRNGLGGYISTNIDNPNPSNCEDATVFEIQVGGGLFLDAGDPLFYVSGTLFAEFKSGGTPPPGAITTFFSGSDGGFLSWSNQAFLYGAAGFCQVPSSGQVYTTFEQQADAPEGCVAVQLQIITNIDTCRVVSSSSSAGPQPTDTASSVVPLSTSSQSPFFPNGTTTQQSASSTDTNTVPTSVPTDTNSLSSTTAVVPSTIVTDQSSSSSINTDTAVPTISPTISSFATTASPAISSVSSSSSVVVTLTSTEIIFVVSSSSTSRATASATPCPFSTSGSILANGGFEDPTDNPFTYSLVGPTPLENEHTDNIVPASDAPVPYLGLCNYILELAYIGGTEVHSDAFANILPVLPLLSGVYSISFDVLACGSTDSSWAVEVGTQIISSGTNAPCGGTGTQQWTTRRGTFTAGLANIVTIVVTGDIGASQTYFDNFVIVPLGSTQSSSAAGSMVTG